MVDKFEILRYNSDSKMKGGKNMDGKLVARRFLAFVIDRNIMFGVAMALMLYGPGSTPEYLLYPSTF